MRNRIRLIRLRGGFARKHPSGIRLFSVCDMSAECEMQNRIRYMRYFRSLAREHPFEIRYAGVRIRYPNGRKTRASVCAADARRPRTGARCARGKFILWNNYNFSLEKSTGGDPRTPPQTLCRARMRCGRRFALLT
jgi:hypothetical protein